MPGSQLIVFRKECISGRLLYVAGVILVDCFGHDCCVIVCAGGEVAPETCDDCHESILGYCVQSWKV
jgi:hypothetical protein